MTVRHAGLIALAVMLLVGAGYLYQSWLLAQRLPATRLEPIYFPVGLGVLLIVLSVIEVGRVLIAPQPGESERFQVPNLGKVLATIGLTAAYFLVWSRVGYFYLATATFFLSLLLVYATEYTPRKIAVMALVTAVFLACIYIVFERAFGIRLN